ncbi:MAG: hypothetical protein V7K25_26970 [Nostoc sp.]|uniref:hypothetical protein n=1 Tax=Nostoc sp. TaxID=1180 RepID=UPI002FFAA9C1
MSRGLPSQFIPFQMLRRSYEGWKPTIKLLPLLVGGWLLLIPNNKVLLAQGIGEILPPPTIPFGQQPSPQLQPAEPLQSNQLEQDFQPSQPLGNNQFTPNQPSQPAQFSQYNQNFERYLVYVDANDFQTLQAIRQIEPSAYIRQYQGRNVIQSGVFNRVSNAQQRVNELQSRGIYNARIISFGNGQEIGVGGGTFGGDRNTLNPPKQASRYYVVIPATQEQLPAIAEQIRQNLARFSQDLGRSGGVLERTQPRGPHVAVGPFSDRFQAGEWNKYLRNLGYKNARVYYGK